MEARFNEAEVICIKRLAEIFDKGQLLLTIDSEDDSDTALNLPPERREAILSTMQDLGIITEVRHSDTVPFFGFKITSKAAQVARAILEQEKGAPMDLVEQMRLTLRRKPLVAWPFIILLCILFIATAINQISGALKALGLTK
jgi:hypothetical protein